MKIWIAKWKEDKLYGSLVLFFLLSVFSSFWRDAIFALQVPLVGSIFPFRVWLAVAVVLYLVWMGRGNDPFWRDSSALEKWVYAFIAILILYGAASLPRAISFGWTFRRLFNLCLDGCFFFLALRLCRNQRVAKAAVYVVLAGLVLLAVMGIWEVFCGGIFSSQYDDLKRFEWGASVYQFPVVSCGNTNDYAMSLLFYGCAPLLVAAQHWKEQKKGTYWAVAVSFGILFFLFLASSARLMLVCFWMMLLGFAAFLLLGDRKRLWIIVLALALCGGVYVKNQYAYTVVPLKQYFAEMKVYRENAAETPETPKPETSKPETPKPETSKPETPKPELSIGDPRKESLEEQFFEIDEETGDKTLKETGSAGVRARLLLHAWDCFVESRGLGVGLGNTEELAELRQVAQNSSSGKYYSNIHCFLARIVADCGIFALLPLCVIAFLLLKRIFTAMLAALRGRDMQALGFAVLFFAVCLTFPIASTASSDAQDNLEMWIYLASVVLLANTLAASQPASVSGPLNTQNPTTLRIE